MKYKHKQLGSELNQKKKYNIVIEICTMLVSRNMQETPYVMMHHDKNYTGNSRFYGFCVDLLEAVARKVGFSYHLKLVPDEKYGAMDPETGEWNGIVRELMQHVWFWFFIYLHLCRLTTWHQFICKCRIMSLSHLIAMRHICICLFFFQLFSTTLFFTLLLLSNLSVFICDFYWEPWFKLKTLLIYLLLKAAIKSIKNEKNNFFVRDKKHCFESRSWPLAICIPLSIVCKQTLFASHSSLATIFTVSFNLRLCDLNLIIYIFLMFFISLLYARTIVFKFLCFYLLVRLFLKIITQKSSEIVL